MNEQQSQAEEENNKEDEQEEEEDVSDDKPMEDGSKEDAINANHCVFGEEEGME